MRIRTPSLAAGLLLAAVLAAPATAGEQRPLTGQFTGEAGLAEPRCGEALTLGFEVKGRTSHLGSLTGTGSNCTEWSLATSAVAIWDGMTILTAADGSTITTTSEGSQGAPVAGRASFSVDHTITGGTGRLAGAAGAFTISGVIDLTTGTVAGQVSGWLSY